MGEVERQLSDRISRLEAYADQGKEDRAEIKESINSLTEAVDSMTQEFARYRGFVGGAALVVTALWAFVSFAGSFIWDSITKGGA